MKISFNIERTIGNSIAVTAELVIHIDSIVAIVINVSISLLLLRNQQSGVEKKELKDNFTI